MKSLLYLFRRYKLASSLNLFGLVIAFTGCYILLTQINFIGSYNHGIKDYENIRRVYVNGTIGEGEWSWVCARVVAENFKKCPQVKSVGYLRDYGEIRFDKDGSPITTPSYLISDDMLTTINTELVDGTLDGAKAIDGGIIIPASLAEKYFGEMMVAGRSMKLSDGAVRNVVGVYKDFPVNCNFANAVYLSMGDENIDNISNWNYMIYLCTDGDVDINALNTTLKNTYGDLMRTYYGDIKEVKEYMQKIKFSVLSLNETYINGYDPSCDRGNKLVYYVLQMAVVLLLLVALINFANFSMAQAPIRLRNINTRKVMGESNWVLRLQLGAEGCIVSLGAFVVAMLLARGISKWEYIGEYTNGSLAISDNIDIVFLLAVTSIILGVLATFYSARYITSFQPALALKGNFGLNPKGRFLRQILVGLQLVMAFIMVVFVGIIYCQRNYIYNSDYGYDKDEVLFADLNEMPSEQYSAVRSELEKINGVESVSFSFDILGMGDRHMKWGRGDGNDKYVFVAIPVDWKFLRTIGIDIAVGRDFMETDKDVYIVNEAMKKKYPKIEIDKPLIGDDLPVLGVCKNFRASTLRMDNNAEPVALVIFGEKYADWGHQTHILYVRMCANTDKKILRKKISQTLASFYKGNPVPDIKFLDDILEQAYVDEMHFITQMEFSAILAFLITIIGVFCLTMFETEYRRKEIAIRKVMGSNVGEVLSLFTRRYAIPLIISFVIAAPIGYYISEQWLQNFAEHTPIYWWLFPLAFIIVSTVVLATVIVQSWRVATMNPVESIKTE
ncbi:MAG: FtsX-like permease family protein [Bacteroidaceae bacterium]|nr:FtsX-like permease family protein [Bacteroidaceae bacterium]